MQFSSKDRKRFLSYVKISGDCHLWTGAVTRSKKSQAGNFYAKDPDGKNKYMGAHKAAWLLYRAEDIPEGSFIRKSCGNALCVNPEHLYLSHKCSDREVTEITYPPVHEFSDSDIQRFLNLVDLDTPGGCELWTGGLDGGGYGRFYKSGRLWPAHAIAWMMAFGELKTDYTVDSLGRAKPLTIVRHRCDVRACVNPDHLVVGTQQDNVDDMIERNRQPWDKKFCPSGHEFTEENMYYHQGKRGCRECRRLRLMSYRTHCVHGHKFTVHNTSYDVIGKRVCLTCFPDSKLRSKPDPRVASISPKIQKVRNRDRQYAPTKFCPSGHEFTEENMYYHQGKRGCRECRKLLHRNYRTHCKNGHEFTSENTRYRNNGDRFCVTCAKSCPSGHEYTEENTYIYRGHKYCKECRFIQNKSHRTHCKHGHEFTPENTRYGRSGRRICKMCCKP